MNPMTPPPPDASIGTRVRYARESKGLSRSDLDRAIGAGPGYIKKIEEFAFREPGAGKLRAISDALGVTLEWLIGTGTNTPSDDDPVSLPPRSVFALPRRPSLDTAPPSSRQAGQTAERRALSDALDAELGAAFRADRHHVTDLIFARDLLLSTGLQKAHIERPGFGSSAETLLDIVSGLRVERDDMSYAAILVCALRLASA